MPISCHIVQYIQILWDTFVHPETSCVQLSFFPFPVRHPGADHGILENVVSKYYAYLLKFHLFNSSALFVDAVTSAAALRVRLHGERETPNPSLFPRAAISDSFFLSRESPLLALSFALSARSLSTSAEFKEH